MSDSGWRKKKEAGSDVQIVFRAWKMDFGWMPNRHKPGSVIKWPQPHPGMSRLLCYGHQPVPEALTEQLSFFMTTVNDMTKLTLGKPIFESFRFWMWHFETIFDDDFQYNEHILAGYIEGSKTWDKLFLRAGVRTEWTRTKGNSKQYNQAIADTGYINFFPNFLG